MATNLLLIGCGKMGGAILTRVAHHMSTCVVDPAAPSPQSKSLSSVAWLSKPEEIEERFRPDVIIIAIKPQQIASALPAYAKYKDSVFLSIAAGYTTATIGSVLGNKGHAIVRSMPNLPASIGEGMTVATANKTVTPEQRELCNKILKAIGTVAWIDDEHHMDAVTALSGSGPAYVFALVESMTRAGEALGLAPAFAEKLARQTVIGSAGLLANTPDSAETLRSAVTSPGGTTEAALKQLLAPGGLHNLMAKAMKAAAQRAKELAQ